MSKITTTLGQLGQLASTIEAGIRIFNQTRRPEPDKVSRLEARVAELEQKVAQLENSLSLAETASAPTEPEPSQMPSKYVVVSRPT